MHGHNPVGEEAGASFDQAKRALSEPREWAAAETRLEYVWRQVVNVEDDSAPEEARVERGGDEKVGGRVNIDSVYGGRTMDPQHAHADHVHCVSRLDRGTCFALGTRFTDWVVGVNDHADVGTGLVIVRWWSVEHGSIVAGLPQRTQRSSRRHERRGRGPRS